jgi:DNA-binding transcriptional MocR family regulator
MGTTGKKSVGQAAEPKPRTWVQTERAAHEAWSQLMTEAPAAAKLAHVLCSRLDPSNNAVVASQRVLAELMGVHRSTVVRAAADLERRRWIQRVQLGGKGGATAYVINDRVAWARRRDDMPRTSLFSAQVIASESEQEAGAVEDQTPLRRIPMLMKGEEAIPSGPGEPPPSQPSLEGLEPYIYREQSTGQLYEHNPETGELQQLIDDGDRK